MRYAIISNPAAGKMSINQKLSALAKHAEILNAEIHGLDTKTAENFSECSREVASHCDVLVIAGGDGTLSDVINSVDTAKTTIAYIPLGTGNSMRYALNYRGGMAGIATRVKEGEIHQYDLISCDGIKRAFIVSVGIEGAVIRLRDKYLARGGSGFRAYLRAFLKAYFREYRRVTAKITVDDISFKIKNLLSLMVVKQPYYGFGMRVVPNARFDDRLLHVLCINSGIFKTALGAVTAFTIGNRVGEHITGKKVTISLERPLHLIVDGSGGWKSDEFTFTILPKALKIKC